MKEDWRQEDSLAKDGKKPDEKLHKAYAKDCQWGWRGGDQLVSWVWRMSGEGDATENPRASDLTCQVDVDIIQQTM